jgi:SAM-dependent methyltransferase
VALALSYLPTIEHYVARRVMHLSHRYLGRLLDVGAGDGSFLAEMANLGYRVEGVEPDVGAYALKRTRNFPVHLGPLDSFHPSEPFDVVTLRHVLEHTGDPRAVLASARNMLRDGGTLVAAVPNVACLSRTFLGLAWSFDVPRHLVQFSAAGLREAVDAAGFQIEREFTLPAPWYLESRYIYRAREAVETGHRPMVARCNYHAVRVGHVVFASALAVASYIMPKRGEDLVVIAHARS